MRYVYAITKVANICEMCKYRREIFMARLGKGLFFLEGLAGERWVLIGSGGERWVLIGSGRF